MVLKGRIHRLIFSSLPSAHETSDDSSQSMTRIQYHVLCSAQPEENLDANVQSWFMTDGGDFAGQVSVF
ncbi:hypothetical protein BKA66DRAFT_455023 [Pyrenochaeta sp. MPI-SDFR-AT-0127]|nr:hypothetical protein BKA66DRAFT_455023 [Pyrenochaeta sp. MPI-SDFR-AT-0127]